MSAAPSDASGIIRVVVGTAGHIDHGKSSLVHRLTGIDPDRLPEEKARGLTIDLGFANLRLSDGSKIGIVDVPGHERFVHNMVAGATGIDVALLVVAADDGVMPQTVEHLEILELLGLRRGAIALTKVDLVPPEMRDLAIDDVRAAVRSTFLEAARLYPVSSATGEGIGELRAGLEELARATLPRASHGVFRMPIQRVFAAKGFGCVVTGIPASGSVAVGDRLQVLPGAVEGSVRGLEAYHAPVARIAAGHSSAINLAGVDAGSCARGLVAVTPGYFEPSRFVEARLRHLPRRRRPLRDRQALRFHAGTKETGATLALLEGGDLAPGADALVQLALDEPVVVAPGDRFLVRIPSPADTVGGGTVLGASNRRLRRRRRDVLDDLAAAERALGDDEARLELELRRAAGAPRKPAALARALGLPESELSSHLEALVRRGSAARLRAGGVVHATALDDACERVVAAVAAHFARHPERLVCERNALREGSSVDAGLLDDVLAKLAEAKRVELEPGGGVRAARKETDLSAAQKALRERALARLESAGCQPPTDDELAAECGVPRVALDLVLKRLVDERAAARVAPDLHFAASAIDGAKEAIVRNCAAHGGELDLPSLRDELRTTRRFLIPLVEWLDTTGFTTRLGARRILKRR